MLAFLLPVASQLSPAVPWLEDGGWDFWTSLCSRASFPLKAVSLLSATNKCSVLSAFFFFLFFSVCSSSGLFRWISFFRELAGLDLAISPSPFTLPWTLLLLLCTLSLANKGQKQPLWMT